MKRLASCGGGGGGAFARFRSGRGAGLAGFASGLMSGLAMVVVVGGEFPFLSCSCGPEVAGPWVAVGFPDVAGASLPLSAGVVSLALGVVPSVPVAPGGDGGAPLAPGTGSALALGSAALGAMLAGVTPGVPGLAAALIDALGGACSLPS